MISQTLKNLIQSTISGSIRQAEVMSETVTTKTEVHINNETQELVITYYSENGSSSDLYYVDGDILDIIEYGAVENQTIEDSYLKGFIKIEL